MWQWSIKANIYLNFYLKFTIYCLPVMQVNSCVYVSLGDAGQKGDKGDKGIGVPGIPGEPGPQGTKN